MKRFLALAVLARALSFGTASAAEVFVTVAPPPPVRVGIVGVAPHPGYVWVEGYHRWHGGRYVWVPGRWARPPYAGGIWVPAQWAPRRGGWVYVPGYWRR